MTARHLTFGRMTRRPSTLTWRIAWLLTAVVLLGGIVTATVATLGIQRLLINSLDSQLNSAANQHEARMPHGHGTDGDGDNRPGASSGPADLRLPIGTITGKIVGGTLTDGQISQSSQSARLSTDAVKALDKAASATSPTSIEVPGLHDYRVVVRKTDDGTLLTGLPMANVNRVIAKVIGIEALTVGLAAALMAACGAYAVRRSMRPLRNVAATAREVSHTPLDTGVPKLTIPPADRNAAKEIRDVSESLDTMLHHVQDALRTRDASEGQLRDFIADASHELRTPVAIVRSHAELIETTVAGSEVPEQVSASLARIQTESHRMGNIVGDLLLLARLGHAPQQVREQVDLSLIVLEVADDARLTASTHRWRIDLPDNAVEVLGDPDQLRRAVLNIVTNAGRHTPAGTHVLIALTQSGSEATITVTDDGPGIPQDVQASLGRRFTRTTHDPRPDSTGLGFALVEAIVTAHNGSVEVDSVPGRTAITLHLPVQ